MADIQILYDGPIIKRKDAIENGDKKYFTGKPCKHGHIDQRHTRSRLCAACDKAHKANYYKRNKEKIKESRNSRRCELLDYFKRYHESNRDKRRWQARERYNNNKDKHSEYRRANREVYASHQRNRRSRKKKAGGKHTKDDVLMILISQGNRCAEPTCRVDLSNGYHVDHIMPLKLGGSNGPENLQCLCATCNLRKSSKHPIDWAVENGRLL